MNSNLITASRMRDYNACRRLHHYKYELGYRSIVTDAALSFGSLIHVGLEQWWGTRGDLDAALQAMAKVLDVDPFERVKAVVTMAGYHSRWIHVMSEFEVLGVEVEYQCKLRNPATGFACRGLQMAGKIDAIARRKADSTVWFVEHKTSSEELSAGSTYWQRLRMDPQVSGYYDGMTILGYEPAGCIYDVISKFSERPKLATPPERRKYTKEGLLYKTQREADETPEEFECRLRTVMTESPDAFFGRAEVCRTEKELEESRADMHATALLMRDGERLSRAPRNPGQCFMYGKACAFFDVCSGLTSLDDETRYKKLDNLHPELTIMSNNNT